MKRLGAVLGLLGLGALAAAWLGGDARAQRLDPRRPATFVVGAPGGAGPTARVDARRSGLSRARLPAGTLRTPWVAATRLTVEQPALAGPDGTLAVVSTRGDVTFVDAETGETRAETHVGAAPVGPATLASDGTVVYTTANGEAVGVSRARAAPRFVTRIGGERNARAAPLSLDDGGTVVATLTELVVLDAEGAVRARTALSEPAAAPLLAAGGRILAVTTAGTVLGWSPGREPTRLGSFGGTVDGAAALLDDGRLVAVVDGTQLVEIDLARGARAIRGTTTQGLWLGPPAVRNVPRDGGTSHVATVLGLTATRAFVLGIDDAGQELLRAPVTTLLPVPLADGGAAPLAAPPHVGPLVDGRGAVAFAATDGRIGVVAPDGSVDTLGDLPCQHGARSGVVGLTPIADGAFTVTCDGGAVVRVNGAR